MNTNKKIYIRNEINPHEYRTPIVPQDVSILIANGFIVYVESSFHRIFGNEEYKENGGIITDKPWYDVLFNDALIIGLKEMNDLDKLSNHRHMFFSHSYKNQTGSQYLLQQFSKSKNIIYDFEYFLDNNNKRIISFGYYAGIVGAILALLQYVNKKQNKPNISNLSYWNNKDEIIKQLNENVNLLDNIQIAVVGSRGNCGKGIADVLNILNIDYTKIHRASDKSKLKDYDILYNCIALDSTENEIWFDNNTQFDKDIIISDISCDYSKPNNPIQLYDNPTSWETPVYKYNDNVDIIAINNLPSLLPKESSIYFSKKCVELLLDAGSESWKKNEQFYYDTVESFIQHKTTFLHS